MSNKPIVETGLPLRNFVRGFLRDHFGMSKIASHLLADLFMERWINRKSTETDVRYSELEDMHTLQKTWDRLAREAVDARLDQPPMTKDELIDGIARMRKRKLQRQGIEPPTVAGPLIFVVDHMDLADRPRAAQHNKA